MKHLRILFLLIGLTCAGNARSDIIMDELGYHQYRISNLEKFPEIHLVKANYYEGEIIDDYKLIKSNNTYKIVNTKVKELKLKNFFRP